MLRYRLESWWDLHSPRYYAKRVKWFIQRGRRGWADCDTWDLDHYLAVVMAGSLEYLSDFSLGYPPEYTWETWQKELRKVAKGFRDYHDPWKFGDTPESTDHSLQRLPHIYYSLWS